MPDVRSALRSRQTPTPGEYIGVALGERTLIDQNSGVNFRLLTLYATWASLAWATALTGLAAAGNTWVLDRVAGGYFSDDGSMPVWLRVVYGGMTLLMLGVARLAYLYFVNDVTRRQRNLGRLVVLLFALSAAVNAASQSPPERYNAIGAGVTMIGIAILRRRPKSDIVDLRLRR